MAIYQGLLGDWDKLGQGRTGLPEGLLEIDRESCDTLVSGEPHQPLDCCVITLASKYTGDMEIMTPELLDLARERGSGFVAAATNGELIQWAWDGTDRDWEAILDHLKDLVQGNQFLYVGVVTEGVTIDSATYDMKEHLTMVVVHPAGTEAYRIPMVPFNALVDTDPVISLGELQPEELEFDLAALRAVLPWSQS